MEQSYEEIGTHLSLKDRVYEYMKKQIITGKLEPNKHLREAELSNLMKISRAPIREALNMLEKEGFVKIIPRKGAVVSSISKEEVESIWEIRSLLEPYAARTAAKECLDNELNKLENKLNKLQKEPGDFSNFMQSDLELHELLYKYLKNKMLKETIVMVRQMALRILNFAEGKLALSNEFANSDIQEHLQIIEALKARDSERASASVFVHIINSKHRIIKALEERE